MTLNDVQNEAYAEGRKDEREQLQEALSLLEEIGRANAAQVAPVYAELARAAIAKATGAAA